jgi:hypothetical protein
MLPTTGTRVPSGPQAKASSATAPVLAKAAASERAVGGIAQHEMVTETAVRSTAPEKAGSPEAFLLGWADLAGSARRLNSLPQAKGLRHVQPFCIGPGCS